MGYGYAARFDDFGRPVWIVATILGFIFFWPVGLALLVFSIWSRRMGCWHYGYADGGGDRWQQRAERRAERWERRAERWRAHMAEHAHRKAERWFGSHDRPSSGNRAFDEYRAETLRRLEDEQNDFMEFLDRLRMAKDKAEFDEFLNERRRRAAEGPEQSPPA